jgi:predicted secreted protein
MTSEENRVVDIGKEFTIDFQNVPTGSGYKWIVIEHTGIMLLGEMFSEPMSVGDLVTQSFRFVGTKFGDFIVRFQLRRFWEKKPILERVILVTVK